mgnify:FL=1|tara:strand:- start:93 stop:329 length:237 start_codon:yes stop_codon:yes gene_type:complete
MKTLVKPLAKFNEETYLNQSYRQNRLKSYNSQYRKYQIKWKFLLIAMSFFTFIIYSESPQIEGDICNTHNNEQVCNIW